MRVRNILFDGPWVELSGLYYYWILFNLFLHFSRGTVTFCIQFDFELVFVFAFRIQLCI